VVGLPMGFWREHMPEWFRQAKGIGAREDLVADWQARLGV
jgi:hypothetical protein